MILSIAGSSTRRNLARALPESPSAHRLSASRPVDAAFEVCQCYEHFVERGWLGEIHVPHRLVISPQGRQAPWRRDQAEGARFGLLVVRPRTAEELRLPCYDLVPQ